MYESSVRTATGKEFPIRFIGGTTVGVTSVLYIEIIGHSMGEIVPVFSNPSETNFIQGLMEGEVVKEYANYTNLIEVIVLAETSNVRIALTSPIDGFGA